MGSEEKGGCRFAGKRVAIFGPCFREKSPAHGGITTNLFNLANEFKQRGVDVEIIAFPPKNTLLSTPRLASDIRVVAFKAKHKSGQLMKLSGYLNASRPDALFAAGHRYNLLAAWSRRIRGGATRVVLSVRNNVSSGLEGENMINTWLRWRSISRFYPWADGISAVSRGVADDLTAHTRIRPEQVKTLFNPVVTPLLFERAQVPPEHPWFLPDEPPVILGIGRLERQKDFGTLIQAFAQVRRQQDCRLMILGEGPLRSQLEALAADLGLKEDVALPGFVENPYAYLLRAGLFVLSSLFEGLPTALIEAMALKVPVVASDCPSGPREILDEGRYGPLVPMGDATALAAAMLKALKAPPDPTALQRRAARFGGDRVIDAYLRYLLAPNAMGPQA
jgi:glycosyltransferase involved in cell wall biosynthesis